MARSYGFAGWHSRPSLFSSSQAEVKEWAAVPVFFLGKIIKPATQKQALVPSTYGDNLPNVYAFGWGLTVAKGRLEIMEHNGNYAGFLTNIVRDVPEQRTLVVLCNVDSVDVGAIERIFQEMPPKRQQK